MAKAEQKEFSWDSEVKINEYYVGDGEKEMHEVKICTLNGKQFVVDTKIVMKQKTGWTPVKNVTIPLSNFDALVEIVSDWKLKDAFGSSSITVEKPKRTKKK